MTKPGSIPVIKVVGAGLAEAWEKSLLALWESPMTIPTQYDGEGERRSKDCMMTVVVEDPKSDPAIHRAFPGGLDSLEEYRQEVLYVIKDHWVRDLTDPEDTRWEYTYHGRLCSFDSPEGLDAPLDQLSAAVVNLANCPYTRRVQATTWQPWKDITCDDPPCLQRLWFRIVEHEGIWYLNLHVYFRSRDAYDAAFMNMWAFSCLQKAIADDIAVLAQREVRVGSYVDTSDSYHIYGKRLEHFETGFLKQVADRTFEERTWTRGFAQPFFNEAMLLLKSKIAEVDARRAESSGL